MAKKKPNQKKELLYLLLAPPAALLLFILISTTDIFQQMEHLSIDWRFKMRAAADEKATEKLLLVGIDDHSLKAYKNDWGKWPWPRTIHAEFLKSMKYEKPPVVGFDIYFTEPTKRHPEDDEAFGDAMKGLPGVITGAVLETVGDDNVEKEMSKEATQEQLVINTLPLPHVTGDTDLLTKSAHALLPIPELSKHGLTAFVNVDPSPVDGMRRYLPLIVKHKDNVYASLVTQMLIKYFKITPDDVKITLGDKIELITKEKTYDIPINKKGEFLINYRSRDGFKIAPFFMVSKYFRIKYEKELREEQIIYTKNEIENTLKQFETAYLNPKKVELEDAKKSGDNVKAKEIEEAIKGLNKQKDDYVQPKYDEIAQYEKEKTLLTDRIENKWPEGLPKTLSDKALFIGQTASGLSDMGPTPLNSYSPLVLVHANAFNNIIKQDFLTKAPIIPIAIVWLILSIGSLFLLRKASAGMSAVLPVFFALAYIVFAFFVFRTQSLQLPLAWPILAFALVQGGAIVMKWIEEQKLKNNIKDMFGTYVSPDLVDQMVESGEEPSLGGADTEITAYFSDVQAFSTFSELLTSPQLVDLMNEYLTAMTDILQEEKGTLDKYIGDAIVAFYGAPIAMEDHAHKSVRTSIRMYDRQMELREKWKSEGSKWPECVGQMQTRIGMNTGIATVGNMGALNRFNYTMMGDMVNLAARCESGAKAFGAYIMVTEESKDASVAFKDDVLFRFLDRIIVKGRSIPVGMYEVFGFKDSLEQRIIDCEEITQQASDAYLTQDWDKAISLYTKAQDYEMHRPGITPGVKENLSTIFVERCQDMKDNPPGKDWDGVYVMTSK